MYDEVWVNFDLRILSFDNSVLLTCLIVTPCIIELVVGSK